jgi:putative ABC transport system permease protein
MIISTLVAYRQLSFIRSKNLGFNVKQVVVVDINSQSVRNAFQAIKTEMARISTVERVSVSSRVPGEWKNITEIDVISEDRQQVPQSMYFFAIDEDFVETFGIELIAGRNISGVMGTDTAAVIINQAAAEALGLEDPLGQQIEAANLGNRGAYQARVIGVVEDFHFQSLHETIEPLVFGHWKNPIREIDYFSSRINPVDLSKTLADLQAVHEQFDKVTPFEYNFLDERLRDFYETDRRVGQIFGITASLAVFIACLGLFGLSAFTTEQRTKEIGVRKVLGASVTGLAGLLSKDFLRLVLLANVLAWPAAWYAMSRWLQVFAYHVDLTWWMFLLAGGIALIIAVVTVSSQAIKAALANPVQSLRYE